RLSVNHTTDFEDTIGTARLDLSVFWPLEVHPHGPPIIDLVSAVDDRGRSLKWEGAEPSGVLTLSSASKPPEREGAWIWLNRPNPDAVKIASVKGRLKLRYLVERKYVTFELPLGEKAQVREYDGIAITLDSFTVKNRETWVSLEISGQRRTGEHTETEWYEDGRMKVHGNMAVLKTGKPDSDVRPSSWGREGKDEKWRLSWVFPDVGAKVTALQFEVDGVIVEDVVPFELKDIPLPK
ncbi:MAG TPA: hypothetical protein VFS19_03230, partial [Planctomycetota bacterium]|nr:hypothetical protein [Planctomycetota bacterium]